MESIFEREIIVTPDYCDASGALSPLAAFTIFQGIAAQHADIGQHLSLVVEQCRVAALPGTQRLDVICELALQKLGGLRAFQKQLAALGAVHHRGLALQELVIGYRHHSGL